MGRERLVGDGDTQQANLEVVDERFHTFFHWGTGGRYQFMIGYLDGTCGHLIKAVYYPMSYSLRAISL